MDLWKRIAGMALAIAVAGASAARAAERPSLPPGSFEVAQVADPRVYALEEQVRQLTGRIEELNFLLLEMQEQVRRMQEDNEFRFQQLEGTGDAGGSTDSEMLKESGDAGNVLPKQTDMAGAGTQARPAPPPQSAESGSAQHGAPPRNLGTLTMDNAGNVVGGEIDFSRDAVESAVDGNAVASVATPGDPEALYREGYNYVLNGDYDLAEAIFRSFVELYPNDPLVADARFWLAESVRGQGRLDEAAEIFIAVRRDYPDSQKAPETLLKIGQIMAALGDRDVACVTFDDAEASYPNMSEAVRALIREERAKAKC